METFNEWMAYIHRELGYPENKIKVYEQNCRREVTFSNHKRWSDKDRRNAPIRKDKDHRVVEAN